jgi:L-lactate dehydrogenase complex protein LldG
MFSFTQNKNNTISNSDLDDLVLSKKPERAFNSYVTKEILENEILNNDVNFENLPKDLDLRFAQNFTAKGGKFVYCKDASDLILKIQSFLMSNKFVKPFVWEDNLYSHFKDSFQNSIQLERNLDEAKCAISLCESLIADEGSLIINPNQNRFRPLEGFPSIHLVIATQTQLKATIEHAVSDFLKTYSDFFPFIIDLSQEEKPTRFASNKPVLNSRGTKQIIVFYCEGSIFGE